MMFCHFVNLKVGHEQQILDDVLLYRILVRRILRQQFRHLLDLMFVVVIPQQQRMIAQFSQIRHDTHSVVGHPLVFHLQPHTTFTDQKLIPRRSPTATF
jgi:hypothetical protein